MPKTISKIHQPCILKTISENCAAPPHTLLHGPAGPPSSTADLPAAASHSYIHRKPHRRQIYTYLNLPSISGAEKIFSLESFSLTYVIFRLCRHPHLQNNRRSHRQNLLQNLPDNPVQRNGTLHKRFLLLLPLLR